MLSASAWTITIIVVTYQNRLGNCDIRDIGEINAGKVQYRKQAGEGRG